MIAMWTMRSGPPEFDNEGRVGCAQPDRFLVGLAVLDLVSEVAAERPLVCVIDDEQWLDHASAQALGFAARRLAADPVGLVISARVPGEELTGLRELTVAGLPDADARALLESALPGPLDARVRDLIVSDGGKSAGAAGAAARADPGSAGRRVRAAARDAAAQPHQRLPAAAGRPAGPDPAADAGGGGRSVRRSGAGPAGRRPTGHPAPAAGRRWRRACWSSAPTCGSGILYCARRLTGRRRLRTGRRCTWRWRR